MAIVAGSQIWDIFKIKILKEKLVKFTLEKKKKSKNFPIS
jgi:hypothetical protein